MIFNHTLKKLSFTLLILCFSNDIIAQINARLLRYPDVSDTQITFVYANDVWIVDKNGGVANKLSSPEGMEMFPKFSPDGKTIAFTGNYEGNYDVYTIPVTGGIPKRLTFHGMMDMTKGWTNDGSSVLFVSSKESGKQRFSQFYTAPTTGGMAVKLSVPYGEFGSYSPDGSQFAFTDRTRLFRTWKRYEGGNAPDIFIFDFNTYETINITDHPANDELPMWSEGVIYFLSDRGEAKRYNIWKYDLNSRQTTQVTNFTDFDIHFPSIGPSEIVFQAGDQLYLLDLDTEAYQPVDIRVITDQSALLPRTVNVSKYLDNATVSPDGKRVVAEARGELFSLPAETGFVKDLTNTSGAAERYPAISPDGKSMAFWSDETGEYQLMIQNLETGNTRKITSYERGFRYNIYWSPDSKKIAYVDQSMQIQYINVETGEVVNIDKGLYMFEGGLRSFSVDWSKDSQWIAYSRGNEGRKSTIFIYNTRTGQRNQLTSGFYDGYDPEFSEDGKHLFFVTNRRFAPEYSDMDNTFIYPNASQLAVVSLERGTESLLKVKNDEIKLDEENNDDEKDKKKDKSEGESTVNIDFTGIQGRIEIIDGVYGNIGDLTAVKGKLLYRQWPNTGAQEGEKTSLNYYDIEEREHKEIANNISGYQVAAKGEKMLVMQDGKLAVIDISEGASIDKTVPTDEMMMSWVPKEEWRQIFNEVWRLERDYFYDPNMHGVDWDAQKVKYGKLIEQAGTRSDVNFILGELIGELNASHTYRGGGDTEDIKSLSVGYLGVNYRVENGRYRIESIVNGADWDSEVRSPLLKPGVDIKIGDYILAVNGREVDATKPIEAWFQGLADKPVEVTYNSSASISGAKKAVLKPLSDETRLRNLEWIENNRKRVEEATNGRVGYVYVPSTGIGGQNELIRMYYGQIHKEAMIIDERFNNGGQIPDRFIELLDRKPLAYWAVRDGKDWQWPPVANFGPKVMLINGFSGSGGDAFPDYFKKAGLGPLIGKRTWGGLIGISGAPSLIDNGYVSVPTFRMYDPDGKWFLEGYGVEPDIEVDQDFQKLANGTDAQLEAAIEEIMRLLESGDTFQKPERPAYEDRN